MSLAEILLDRHDKVSVEQAARLLATCIVEFSIPFPNAQFRFNLALIRAAKALGLLSLAQGGETTLVLQPYLGVHTTDYRVYMIDGFRHSVMLRVPGPGAIYPQYTTGATISYVDLPDELLPATAYLAERLPIPYFCADFLHDGEHFWLSEIEPDGTILCPDPTSADAVDAQRRIIRDRFSAYADGHAAFLGGAR